MDSSGSQQLAAAVFTEIAWGSAAYREAARLRHRLFYQEHGIPLEAMAAARGAYHAALLHPLSRAVLAYGYLEQNSPDEFQIYQMVVHPDCQSQGLGRRLLGALGREACHRGALTLMLHARTTKLGFYQRSWFVATGAVFPSSVTGVPHIKMVKSLVSFHSPPAS